MNNLLSIFLLITISISCFATTIDKIKTNEDAELFVQTRMQIKRFTILPKSDSSAYYETVHANENRIIARYSDSLKISTWEKADFDGNGKTDLVITGYLNDIRCVFICLDKGRKYTVKVISTNQWPYEIGKVYFPKLYYQDKCPLLLIYKFDDNRMNKSAAYLGTDTLAYKFGGFIEHNNFPINHNIESINFLAGGCLGKCPIFELNINQDCIAKYEAIDYNKKKGKFTSVLDTFYVKDLQRIINYINFAALKEDYSVGWTDDQTCTLVITYDNGLTKTISDYGKHGTKGLELLYRKLFMLRKIPHWKKERE